MEENRKEKIYKIIMLVLVVAFITFTLTSILVYNLFSNNGNIKFLMLPSGDNTDLDVAIQKVRSVIDKTYINADEINEEDLIEYAVKGYVAGLKDPYTEYMTSTEWEEYQEDSIGNYQGIGVYLTVTTDTNEIIVVAPIEESVAEKAGIQSGDIIKKINDVEYTGEQLDEATAALHGEIGEKIALEVKRGEEILNFDLTREVVRTSPIEIEMLENNIGYMNMVTFDEGIAEDFINKCQMLKNQGATYIRCKI